MDAALNQVDWEAAANDKRPALSERARRLREDARRSMLAGYAPVMMLNDWADVQGDAVRPVSTVPLPGMHPATARGIIALRDRGLPHPVVLTFAMDYGRIRATAKINDAPY